jgi:hypothetical protein
VTRTPTSIRTSAGSLPKDRRTNKFTQLAHALREARAIKNDYQRNVKIIEAVVKPSPPEDSATTLAEKILAAGRKRRGEETEQDQAEQAEKLSPTAKAIINAGRRRRNEPEI